MASLMALKVTRYASTQYILATFGHPWFSAWSRVIQMRRHSSMKTWYKNIPLVDWERKKISPVVFCSLRRMTPASSQAANLSSTEDSLPFSFSFAVETNFRYIPPP